MNLKIKYYSYIIILHVVITVILFYLFEDKKYLFLAAECFILLSLYISFQFYKSFVYPLKLIKSGQHSIKDEDFSIRYNHTGYKEVDNLIDVYNGMIDRLRTEKTKTEEQGYFLNKLIQHAPIGIIIMDYDGKIDSINDIAIKLSGDEKLVGKSFSEINNSLAETINGIDIYNEEIITLASRQKLKCYVHEIVQNGFPRKFIILEELTNELLKAEKDAFGKVIRMMAHEVNNSMGAINSILNSVKEYGLEDSDPDDELKKSLDVAIERNNSLAQFTDNFAEIIRLPKPDRKEYNLTEIIDNIIQFYSETAKKSNIELIKKYDHKKIIAFVDKVQFEQVLSNIIKNAMQSIVSDGKIFISLDDNPVRICIIDNGPGISIKNQEKLFTPFFSTKTNGQGIGLMLIRDILNAHQADFNLSTDSKTGLTTFEIIF